MQSIKLEATEGERSTLQRQRDAQQLEHLRLLPLLLLMQKKRQQSVPKRLQTMLQFLPGFQTQQPTCWPLFGREAYPAQA